MTAQGNGDVEINMSRLDRTGPGMPGIGCPNCGRFMKYAYFGDYESYDGVGQEWGGECSVHGEIWDQSL